MDDVDLVVRNCYVMPVEEIEQRLTHQEMSAYLGHKERAQAAQHPLYRSHSNKLVTVSHHLAHAYSAFAICPFDDGVVMVVDGVGSYCSDVSEDVPTADKTTPLARESESFYKFSGSKIEPLKKVLLEPSRGFLSDEFYNMAGLGALYSRASTYIFGDWNKCGELMGLAPYGRPGQIEPLLEIKNNILKVREWGEDFNQPWISESGHDWEKCSSMSHWKDIAWRVQEDTEAVLLHRAAWLRETTGAKNLCIAGGVGLNCVANGRLARESGFDNVWIQPAAGDDGIAIGCAYYGHLALQNKQRSYVLNNAYFGKAYAEEEVKDVVNRGLIRLVTKRKSSTNICADSAKKLAEGHVVGWFQGRSEFGPRALGNRSILADPRSASMKEILNSTVKYRQAFRPFAPIVLEERANDIFEGAGDSPFMLMAKHVRPEWKDRIAAVVHVDGTARVQTVRQKDNEALYRLLQEFDAITGVPILLNTSFNVKGEPIVERPHEAVECFLTTGIDYLAIHDLLLSKNGLHRVVSPILRAYSDVRSIIQANANPA